MKAGQKLLRLVILLPLVLWFGCRPAPAPPISRDDNNNDNIALIYHQYAPVDIDIMPLTGFEPAGQGDTSQRIKVLVSMLDAYGCQVKAPAVFRFELFDYVSLSPEPKGKRLILWPDLDLTDAAENNKYWSDYLRAYKFYLDLDQPTNRTYILQVTCICPGGRRLSDNFVIKSGD